MSIRRSILRAQAALLAAACALPLSAVAGGISIGGTRIVYPADAKLQSVSARNSSTDATFLVQSWVEDAKGKKSHDFIVTPPLYSSGPGNENTLRLLYVGQQPESDRETLYYFNAKAIPSVDKEKLKSGNMLLIATVTRLKLFLRPHGLKMTVGQAPDKLTFKQKNSQLVISNPTPYYLTLCGLKAGTHALENVMVAPFGNVTEPMSGIRETVITYHTINDFGATTSERHAPITYE